MKSMSNYNNMKPRNFLFFYRLPILDYSNMQPNSEIDDMYIEANRLKSFESNWSIAFIDPKILATIGMFYIGPEATAKCFSCGTEISEWKKGEPEIVQHKHQASHCPLLVWEEEKNVPLDELALARIISNQWPDKDNLYKYLSLQFEITDRDFQPEDDYCCSYGCNPYEEEKAPSSTACDCESPNCSKAKCAKVDDDVQQNFAIYSTKLSKIE